MAQQEKIRQINNRTVVLEDPSIDNLKMRMRAMLSRGFKLNPRHGYTVEENITHYENVVEGQRYQGILERK